MDPSLFPPSMLQNRLCWVETCVNPVQCLLQHVSLRTPMFPPHQYSLPSLPPLQFPHPSFPQPPLPTISLPTVTNSSPCVTVSNATDHNVTYAHHNVSPKNNDNLRGHSILASILRGEDFSGGSGTSSSGGMSPHSDTLDVENTTPPPFNPNSQLAVSVDRSIRRVSSPSSQSSHSSCSPCSQFAPLAPNSQALCSICEDKASGFHYGVVSCEGCKGFFRRTVQKNMSYRCHKSHDCPVSRTTRNRCQSCRFHKCVHKGMRVESVRPERTRKKKEREEQEELEMRPTKQMQETIDAVLRAHNSTRMNQIGNLSSTEDALNAFGTAEGHHNIKSFCDLVPQFTTLDSHDQALLFQHSALEIMMVRAAEACCRAGLTDKHSNSQLGMSVIKLRDKFTQYKVTPEEVSLLAGICLLCPTRPELQSVTVVDKIQEGLLDCLRIQGKLQRQDKDGENDSQNKFHCVFPSLLMKIADLRMAALKCNQQMQGQMLAQGLSL